MDSWTSPNAQATEAAQPLILPGLLGAVASDVSTTSGIPLEAACVLCLLVAGAAVGAAARIRPGTETEGIAPNLFLALPDDSRSVQTCISLVLRPLRQIQSELIDALMLRKPHLDIREKELRCQLTRLDTARFPDGSHVAAVQDQLRRLRQQSQVRIIADDLRSGRLASAMDQSFDGAILHVLNDSTRIAQVIQQAGTGAVLADAGVLTASWQNRPFLPTESRASFCLAAPCASQLLCGDLVSLNTFLHHPAVRAEGLSELFVIATTEPEVALPQAQGSHSYQLVQQWDQLVRQLHAIRIQGKRMYGPAAGGANGIQN